MRREQADCYEYVRSYYKVPAYVGVRVQSKERVPRSGVLAWHAPSQYVYVLFDGDKRPTGPFHPTDLVYEQTHESAKADPAVVADAGVTTG